MNFLGFIENKFVSAQHDPLQERIIYDESQQRMIYTPLNIRGIEYLIHASENNCQGMWRKHTDVHIQTDKSTNVSLPLLFWQIISKWVKRFIGGGRIDKEAQKLSDPEIPAIIKTSKLDFISLGIPLPAAFRNCVFLDLPGAGSVYLYDRNTESASGTARIRLHVLDGEHIGSKLSETIIKRDEDAVSSVVYVVNKSDLLVEDDIRKIKEFLHQRYNILPAMVSALWANTALQLHDECCSVSEICHNAKINLTRCICSKEWDNKNIENNRSLIEGYLGDKSNLTAAFDALTAEIIAAHTGMESFCTANIVAIIDKYICKLDKTIVNVEQQYQQRISGINERAFRIQKTLKAIENFCDFCDDEIKTFKRDLGDALKDIQEGVKNHLLKSMRVQYGEYEQNLKTRINACITSSMCDITPRMEFSLSQIITRLKSSGDFLSLEFPAAPYFAWKGAMDFRNRLVEKIFSMISPIVSNDSDKPSWLSLIFSSKKLSEYQNKKIKNCEWQWEMHMGVFFESEEEEIYQSHIPLIRGIKNSAKGASIAPKHEQRLLDEERSQVQNETAKTMNALREDRSNLAATIDNLNNMEVKHEY